jgi:hypothetical protein
MKTEQMAPHRPRGSKGKPFFVRVEGVATRVVLPAAKFEELSKLAAQEQRSVQVMVEILVDEALGARKTKLTVAKLAESDRRNFSHMASILVEEGLARRFSR